jgi:hypothetical protein
MRFKEIRLLKLAYLYNPKRQKMWEDTSTWKDQLCKFRKGVGL